MLNLYKLEVFAAVARSGSFSAAAQQLLLTQPAVSQHIHDLETALGARLFERTRRGATLTPAGERLHTYTRAILKLVAEAENAVTDVRHLAAGQIRLGATPGISTYLLPEPVQEFHRRYPNLTVSMQTATTPQIVADLRTTRLDLGLIEGELDAGADPSLGVQPLEVVEQGVVVGPRHAWWGRAEVAFAELGEQVLVMRQRNSQTRVWLEGLLAEHGLHPPVGAEFDNPESIKRAVANSTQITVLPEYAVLEEIEGGRLRWLPLAGKPLQRTLKLVWNRAVYFTPVTRAFLDCMRLCLPQLAPEKLETVN